MVAVGPIGIASGGGGGGGRGALGEGGRRHPQGLLVTSISNFSTIIVIIVTNILWSRRNTGVLVFSTSITIFILMFIYRLRKQRDHKEPDSLHFLHTWLQQQRALLLIVNQNENVLGLVLSARWAACGLQKRSTKTLTERLSSAPP